MSDEHAWSRIDAATEPAERRPASEDTGPASLGRYELVYEIGRGGMANVYLARASGVAGFRRWCAIKRIHPHLAKDKRFVSMFLDEARIAAALNHPNVAHVFDLGREGGTYFIAMEYLHGENLGSVGSAAGRSRRGLGPEVAAWIISQAARGLHHAHEATDDTGKPLELVHRDVSPQNIFVTYDGSVKVTDFGIAKATNRTTHTQTGHLKGKCAYMAPEQALGQAVDRRADLFALGVVLWEQSTGHYLFRADSDAVTLLRVTSGEITKPSAVVKGYPRDLERIVMRSLTRLPSERYRTAEEMAKDLERFLADHDFSTGADDVAALVKQLFAKRIAAKDSILSGKASAELPAALRAGEDETRSSWRIAQSGQRAVARTSIAPRRHRATWTGVGLGVLGIGAAALAYPHFMSTPNGSLSPPIEPARATPAAPAVAAAPTPEPVVEQLTPTAAAANPAVDVAVQAPVDAGQAAEVDEPRHHHATPVGTARLSLITRPWALVWINGRSAGETPLMEARVPAGRIKIELQPEGTGRRRTMYIRAGPDEIISRNLVLQ